MKKILSVILISLLLLSIVPFAYAEETTYNVGDIIQFGSYPQSEVKDEALIAKLNSLAPEWKDWTSYEYYFYNEETESLEKGDYMRYVDIEVAGKKYRGVRFTKRREVWIFDFECEPNTTYWYRFEKLKWVVIDPEEGFVLCKDTIDSQPFCSKSYYNAENKGSYSDPDFINLANDYETSSIRKWLNNNFYNTSFNELEKGLISTSVLANDGADSRAGEPYETIYDITVYNYIEDKIFLLSVGDLDLMPVENYVTKASKYACCQGLYDNDGNGSLRWHLRTKSSWESGGDLGSYVFTAEYHNGYTIREVTTSINMYTVGDNTTGVRPAIKISDLSAIPQVEEELPEEPTTPENPDTPEEPDTPDTPNVPEDPTDGCPCNCHKSGFWGFIWKITLFFEKLFGVNRECACGVAHY